MRFYKGISVVIVSALFTACGGGGGSKKSDDNPNPVTPTTQVSLQIKTEKLQLAISEGDKYPVILEGTWSASNLGNNTIFIKVIDSQKNTLGSAVVQATDDRTFKLDTFTNHTLAAGVYTSSLSFIACKDINCTGQYASSNSELAINLQVAKAPEWQTHQANALHNGYVPIYVDTTNFTKLWEWQREPSAEPIGGINAPAAGTGVVYVSTDVYFGDAAVIALDEKKGSELWRVSFGNMPALNPPALNDKSLFIATSGHENTKLWGINRQDGKLQFQSGFSSQWGHYLAPTASGDMVLQTGGYYGGSVTAFSVETGVKLWDSSETNSWGMDSAAIDDKHVYVHGGSKLTVIDKQNGKAIAAIDDPFGNSNYDYHGAPVVGSRNNILAFSGGGFSGRASSNVEQYEDRVISSFDILNNKYEWTSAFSYKPFFAVGNGVVYAGKNNPVSIDAMDETTGKILWSWTPPSTSDNSFHRNIVLTNNLLFVSTNSHIYAVDIKTKKSVWQYDAPGMITITDNRTLILAVGARESTGALIAFDLRSK